MDIKTKNGLELSHHDIVELLKDWGTHYEVGEQYSIITMASFMIKCLDNIHEKYGREYFDKFSSFFDESQRMTFLKLSEYLENHIDTLDN